MNAIQFERVTKRYGGLTALDAVNLAVPVGQKIAILGPNGAGKTTAISLMLGLRSPSEGNVRVLGSDPRNARTRTAMGAMLQTSGIPAHLRVGEAIRLFSSYYPRPLAFERVVATCGLEEKTGAKITGLSGGQLQRLYFALAICGDPQIVLLDEPTVGLDVEARRALLATIDAIAQQGRTVVLTTHYLEEADALADRIVVVDRGTIVADGSPAEIKSAVTRKRVTYTIDGKMQTVLTDRPEALLRDVFAAGEVISDLTVTGASLEEAFLQLTAREDASDAA